MTEIRALTADEWRRLRLARMAAVAAMPYYARALFALVPVAAVGLGTFAVDKHWRLYIDPNMLGTAEGWDIPTAGAVLVHEVGHVLRHHGDRAEAMDAPVDRAAFNVAADAEINDDLLAAGLRLPEGVITPAAIDPGAWWCLGCTVDVSPGSPRAPRQPPPAAPSRWRC